MRISVVIPALNEAAELPAALAAVRAGAAPADPAGDPVEVIVVDGGSADDTAAVARRAGAAVIEGPRGRGAQLAAGGGAAAGEVILFCHADCRLPAGWSAAVRRALAADPRVVAGAFRLAIEGGRPGPALVAATANLRSRLTGHPYGDQALFVRAEAYRAIGGFRPLPLMEDIDICRRLRRLGRLVQLDLAVTVSARRWEREGWVYATLRNAVLATLYYLGVDPARLTPWYRDEPASGRPAGEPPSGGRPTGGDRAAAP